MSLSASCESLYRYKLNDMVDFILGWTRDAKTKLTNVGKIHPNNQTYLNNRKISTKVEFDG